MRSSFSAHNQISSSLNPDSGLKFYLSGERMSIPFHSEFFKAD